MKKRGLYFFVFIALSITSYASYSITEIMFNPSDSNEWVEILYVGNKTDILGLEIEDNYYKDSIVCCNFDNLCNTTLINYTLFLVLDQDTTFIKNTTNRYYCVDDNSIGNGLGNSGDMLVLYIDEKVEENISYSSSVSKGNSLHLVNSSFIESSPTPWQIGVDMFEKENTISPQEKVHLELVNFSSDLVFSGIDSKLFKIINKDYPGYSEEIFVDMTYNVSKLVNMSYVLLAQEIVFPKLKSYTSVNTGKFLFSPGQFLVCARVLNASVNISESSLDSYCYYINSIDTSNITCNVSLEIFQEEKIYDDGEKISINYEISNETFPYLVEYWVEDLFGNIVKKVIATNNDNKKSFTPKISGSLDVLIIKTNLTSLSCNNTDNRTYDEEIIIIKGIKEQKNKIMITSAPKTANFGDQITVGVIIHKGKSSKNAIKAYLSRKDRRVPYTANLKVFQNYQTYELEIPIWIKNNCANSYAEGIYDLVVEGLDTKDQVEIRLSDDGSLCQKEKVIENYDSQEKNKEYALTFFDSISKTGDVTSYVTITNIDNSSHIYSVWSYIYRGSKSYSGDRESNIREIPLSQGESEEIILNNFVNISGEYKLKVKILRDDRKTPFEFTKDITIDFPLVEENIYLEEELFKKVILNKINTTNISGKKENRITGDVVVYESDSIKIKKALPFALIFIFFLLFIAWKNS